MKLRIGDKVRVMVGKDKGKEGKIPHTFAKENKIIVEGINLVKKHRKPNNSNETGGIIETEAKINASNVMFLDEKGNPTRKISRKESKKASKTKEVKEKAPAKTEAKKETKKKTTAKKAVKEN